MGGLFGTVLDTTNSTGFGLETFRLTSLMKGRHLLLSIYWLSCSKLESHFTLLIKSVSNFCSNLMKLGPQVDFGLSQAHKKSHAHIWSLRVFSDTLYYKHSSDLLGDWILTKLNTHTMGSSITLIFYKLFCEIIFKILKIQKIDTW